MSCRRWRWHLQKRDIYQWLLEIMSKNGANFLITQIMVQPDHSMFGQTWQPPMKQVQGVESTLSMDNEYATCWSLQIPNCKLFLGEIFSMKLKNLALITCFVFFLICHVGSWKALNKGKQTVSNVFCTLYGFLCVILFSDYWGYADYNHVRVGACWELILILIPEDFWR